MQLPNPSNLQSTTQWKRPCEDNMQRQPYVTASAETGVMQLQAEECQKLPSKPPNLGKNPTEWMVAKSTTLPPLGAAASAYHHPTVRPRTGLLGYEMLPRSSSPSEKI
ncbi:Centrosomal protein of 126 kDa [Manis javanica]|nr:Centrosomal protein of 126 kDa [Manis javanica]